MIIWRATKSDKSATKPEHYRRYNNTERVAVTQQGTAHLSKSDPQGVCETQLIPQPRFP